LEDNRAKSRYRCVKCGYSSAKELHACPNCGYGQPLLDEREFAQRMSELEKPCPKCGTVMRCGFIVERNSPLHFWTIGEGIYWSPDEEGVIGSRVAVKAYACPECGYIEHYVRRLEKDREIILRAPTTRLEV